MRHRWQFPLALFLAALLVGCRPEPRAIHLGEDACAHCMMTIVDRRFSTQIVLRTGRTLVFDAIECLARYMKSGEASEADVHSIWVTDFLDGNRFLPAEGARYLRSDHVVSPMGLNLVALDSAPTSQEAVLSLDGDTFDWIEVRRLVDGAANRHRH